jgi:hypothetical protein
MKEPSTPYWDRAIREERIVFSKLKVFVIKLKLFVLAKEPALSIGAVVGAAASVTTWIQTNQITTLRQLVTFAAPIVISFVIRTFVSSPATTAKLAARATIAEAKLAQLKVPPTA